MSRCQPGDRISNYLLDERLGRGAFGEVWKAHHHVFNEPVAIKIPNDPSYVRQLQTEGVAIHGLNSPRIVRGLDLDPYHDPPYLIMEYVDGPSLRQVLDEQTSGLPVEETISIFFGVLAALDVAHRAGVIHRDVKPANVMICGGASLEGFSPNRVKLTDFGLGLQAEQTRVSMMQSMSLAGDRATLTGTLAYMSPEQRDGGEVDARTDIYAAGVILHEMLTGQLPQGSDSPSAFKVEIPAWLDTIFQRCYTAKDRRYRCAKDVLADLRHHWPDAHEWEPRDVQAARAQEVVCKSPALQRCVRCEKPVQSDDHYCTYCGQQLVESAPQCPTCHYHAARTDNFCIRCGTDLRPGRRG